MGYRAVHDLLPLRQEELYVFYVPPGSAAAGAKGHPTSGLQRQMSVPQPNMGVPGAGDLIFAFLGDAGVTGRVDISDPWPDPTAGSYSWQRPLQGVRRWARQRRVTFPSPQRLRRCGFPLRPWQPKQFDGLRLLMQHQLGLYLYVVRLGVTRRSLEFSVTITGPEIRLGMADPGLGGRSGARHCGCKPSYGPLGYFTGTYLIHPSLFLFPLDRYSFLFITHMQL